MSTAKVMSHPVTAERVQRWALGEGRVLRQDARGSLVRYNDYRRLRLAYDRANDKLRQVSQLYRKPIRERDAIRQRYAQHQAAKSPSNNADQRAQLAALTHLAHVVARRAGNSPEIE